MRKVYAIIEKDPVDQLDKVGGIVVIDTDYTLIEKMTDLLAIELPEDSTVAAGDIYSNGEFISPEQ